MKTKKRIKNEETKPVHQKNKVVQSFKWRTCTPCISHHDHIRNNPDSVKL